MKWRSLPPTGNPVIRRSDSRDQAVSFPGYRTVYTDSGTTALAFALFCLARDSHFENPGEVIVPGYCCPDLVSAVVYAGLKPVIVDVSDNDPSYDLQKLRSSLNKSTVAIIAINFLGVRERITELQGIASSLNIAVIEDNAQWFPDNNSLPAPNVDFRIFSFGRGKAVSLLGGGMVCIADDMQPFSVSLADGKKDKLWALKTYAYQILSVPYVYRWVESIPFLKLGSTRYHPLHEIRSIDKTRQRKLTKNIDAYRKLPRVAEHFYLKHLSGVNLLDSVLRTDRAHRLLRFPMLFSSQQIRDRVFNELSKKGLGASKMYQKSLPEIEGLPDISIADGSVPNAQSFADRFLTLPTHSGVSERDCSTIVDIIKKEAGH